MNYDVVQIGAHKGNTHTDPVFKYLAKDATALLVEPVPRFFRALRKNYAAWTSVEFANLAIGDCNGQLKLFVPHPQNKWRELPRWADQLASTNPDHIPTILPSMRQQEVFVDCLTINSLFERYDVTEIGQLFVDTEGHDYNVLMPMDLGAVSPREICFEHVHTDGAHVRSVKYAELLTKFTAAGYVVERADGEDTLL
ncbi:FkbM family methyltransferase, partial [uncultured Amphritea sp.]|uniref:FkbM family methyltransferase n=1 Tax=uncultured Amphritea sp. TaxID=981605 RepID=UPI00260A58DB